MNSSEFEAIAKRLEDKYLFSSNPNVTDVYDPDYLEILAQGMDIVPFVIKRLEAGHIWLNILTTITGENPVPEELAGEVETMIKCWEMWYQHQD